MRIRRQIPCMKSVRTRDGIGVIVTGRKAVIDAMDEKHVRGAARLTNDKIAGADAASKVRYVRTMHVRDSQSSLCHLCSTIPRAFKMLMLIKWRLSWALAVLDRARYVDTHLSYLQGKPVENNSEGYAHIRKEHSWRQYMNRYVFLLFTCRKGGFNRPLDKV